MMQRVHDALRSGRKQARIDQGVQRKNAESRGAASQE